MALVLPAALAAMMLAPATSEMPQQAAVAGGSAGHGFDFDEFVSRQGRSYRQGTAEYAKRRELFQRSTEEVALQNRRLGRLWTAGINHFSDRTMEELNVLQGWRRGPRAFADLAGSSRLLELEARDSVAELEVVDWRNLSMAYNVYDQGHCGSCWAVATVAVLEAHHEIAHGTSRTFSAQELISCVKNPHHCGGKGGCDGATVELGLKWALDSGLENIDDEPYEGVDKACKKKGVAAFKNDEGTMDKDGRIMTDAAWQDALEHRDHASEAKGKAFGLSGFQTLVSNKEPPLVRALIEQGPVAIAVAANGWFPYESGIFDSCRQDWVVNHAVSLFGYGHAGSGTQTQRYWLIRNSWGPNWGERGYIRMIRTQNEESQCGQDTSPQEGVACDGGPSQVTVCGSCGILYDSVVPKIHGKSSAPAPAAATAASAAGEDTGAAGGTQDPDEMRVLQAESQGASAVEQSAALDGNDADEDAEARTVAVGRAATSLHRSSVTAEADVAPSVSIHANTPRRGLSSAGDKLLRRELSLD